MDPLHIAIIMDGNGRWASSRGLERSFGHREGFKAALKVAKRASELQIPYLTLYALSIDNLSRPKEEIISILSLIESIERTLSAFIDENEIRFLPLGDLTLLPASTRKALLSLKNRTRERRGLTLQIAAPYSGENEIRRAIEKMKMVGGKIDENLGLRPFLDNPDVPDPDIIVRSGGEKRLSGFLLYESSYTELAFYDKLWPDWGEEMLDEIIAEFHSRKRKYGKIGS